jgi:UDP-N-acetylglucosamine:LPS N-acetylglucosamine transferase
MTQEAKERLSLLITVAGGGFSSEAFRLVEGLKDQCDFTYVTIANKSAGIQLRLPVAGDVFYINDLGLMGTRIWDRIRNVCRALVQAQAIVSAKPYDGVITLGSSIAVPLLIAARRRRIKCLFVESVTRVRSPSLTARIVYHLRLCDRFYVQWAELLRHFPRAVHKGMLW